MKRAATAFGVAAIGLWSAGIFAQGRNLAGSWTVDMERTAAEAINSLAAAGATGGGVRSGGGGGRGGAGVGSGGAVVGARSGGGGTGGAGGAATGGGARGRSAGAAGPMTIALDATTFTVGSGETSTAYRLDGSPTTVDLPNGKATTKAGWKDDRLVIETTTDGISGPIVTTVVWYLEGDSLVRETHVPGPDGQTRVRKTYFKRA